MAIMFVVNPERFARSTSELVSTVWAALPSEVTTTAAAYPSRALLSVIVLSVVLAGVSSTFASLLSSSVLRLLVTAAALLFALEMGMPLVDRKSTRLNSSHT